MAKGFDPYKAIRSYNPGGTDYGGYGDDPYAAISSYKGVQKSESTLRFEEDEKRKRAEQLRQQLKKNKIKFNEQMDDDKLLARFGNDKIKYGGTEKNVNDFFKEYDSKDEKTQKQLFYGLRNAADKGDGDAQDALYKLKSTGRSRENSVKDAIGDWFVGGEDRRGFADNVPVVGLIKRGLVDNLSGYTGDQSLDEMERIAQLRKGGKISAEDTRVLQDRNTRITANRDTLANMGGGDDTGDRFKAAGYAGGMTFLDLLGFGGSAGVKELGKQGAKQAIRKGGKEVAQDIPDDPAFMRWLNTLDKRTIESMAARGGVEGAGYGAIDNMRNEDASVGDYIKGGIVGGLMGGILNPAAGKLTGLAGDVNRGVNRKVTGDTAGDIAMPELSTRNPIKKLDRFITEKGGRMAEALGEELARIPGVSKVVGARQAAVQKLIEPFDPIYRLTRQMERDGTIAEGTTTGLRELIGTFKRPEGQIRQFFRNSEGGQALNEAAGKSLSKKKDYESLGQALADIRELNLIEKGVREGNQSTNVANLTTRLDENPQAAQAQEVYKALNTVYGELLDRRVAAGLLDARTAEKWKGDFDYIRLQKEQDEWAKLQARQSKSAKMGSAARATDKKLKKKVDVDKNVNPLDVLLDYTRRTEQEIQGNRIRQNIAEILAEAGEAKYVRDTDKVLKRSEIYASLADSKETRDQLAKTIRTHKKTIKALEKYQRSLQARGQQKLMDKKEDLKNYMIRESAGVDRLPGNGKKMVSAIDDPERFIAEYVSDPKNGFRSLVERLSKTDERVATLKSELDEAAGDLTSLSQQRRQQLLEARALKDGSKTGRPTIEYWDQGIKNTVVVKDPTIVSALRGLTDEQIGFLGRTFRGATKALQFGATGGNPAFAIPNLIRDQAFSFVNSKNAFSTHNPVQIMRAVIDTFAAEIFGSESEGYRRFKTYNSGSNFVDFLNQGKVAGSREAREALGGKVGAKEAPARTARKSGLDRFLAFSENLTRYQNFDGTFRKASKQIDDEVVAARYASLAARDNSTDFLNYGEYMRALNSALPYVNAGVQGARAMLRSFKERPTETSLKVMGVMGVPIIASTQWNLSDDKRADIYFKIPEYQREMNIIYIPPTATVGADGKPRGVIMIPKAPGVAQLVDPMRLAMEARFMDDPVSARDVFTKIFEATTSIDSSSGGAVVNKFTPQLFRPAVNQVVNRDMFTGAPIVDPELLGLDPSQQVYEKTSGTARQLGDMLGISPIRVEKFLKDSLGESTGVVGVNTIDRAQNELGADIPVGGRGLGESIERRFTGVGDAEPQDFYDAYEPLKSSRDYYYKKIRNSISAGKPAEAERLSAEWDNRIMKVMLPYYSKYSENQFAPEFRIDQIESLRVPVEKGKIQYFSSKKK